jgi:hypothetical protein
MSAGTVLGSAAVEFRRPVVRGVISEVEGI